MRKLPELRAKVLQHLTWECKGRDFPNLQVYTVDPKTDAPSPYAILIPSSLLHHIVCQLTFPSCTPVRTVHPVSQPLFAQVTLSSSLMLLMNSGYWALAGRRACGHPLHAPSPLLLDSQQDIKSLFCSVKPVKQFALQVGNTGIVPDFLHIRYEANF